MNNDKNNKEDEERPTTALFDALVLRYNMSHKVAAESLSLPRALENGVPVVAFTTTRWNRLLQQRCPTTSENKDDDARDDVAITSADCIEFMRYMRAVGFGGAGAGRCTLHAIIDGHQSSIPSRNSKQIVDVVTGLPPLPSSSAPRCRLTSTFALLLMG